MKAFKDRNIKNFIKEIKKLTPAQIYGALYNYLHSNDTESFFMFKRSFKSQNLNLIYQVMSKILLNNYESEADRIIREGLVTSETVFLSDKRDSTMQFIFFEENKPAVVYQSSSQFEESDLERILISAPKMVISQESDGSKESQVFKYVIGEIIDRE